MKDKEKRRVKNEAQSVQNKREPREQTMIIPLHHDAFLQVLTKPNNNRQIEKYPSSSVFISV